MDGSSAGRVETSGAGGVETSGAVLRCGDNGGGKGENRRDGGE